MTSNIILSTKEYNVVGTRPIRHDGYDKVTGKALYSADMNLPSMLFGKVLRSPHAHAIIKSIDTSKAEAHPDVRAVVTSADFVLHENKPILLSSGGIPQNMFHRSSNCLARGKVFYKGHAVAAVAADTVHAAEEAMSLIEVEYEILPAVTDVESAMAEGAPQLHDNIPGNVASHTELELGDLEKGFAEADLVMEKVYRTNTVHQGYIEPFTSVIDIDDDGRIQAWCSSKAPFRARRQMAEALGLNEETIRVNVTSIGGDFGGKGDTRDLPIAYLLAKMADRPVKIVMSSVEELTCSKRIVYDINTFEQLDSFSYNASKEGWGLCNDGTNLYKSDGTSKIWILNAETLAEEDYIQTVSHKTISKKLNELEWVNGKIYANNWQIDLISIINPKNGAIEGLVDFRSLRKQVSSATKEDVLNGIAYNKETGKLYVTGKNWDKLFEVKIIKK